MGAVLRVTPFQGETTWSFLHRVAAAYRLQVTDLTARWQWVNPVHPRRAVRPDGEVILDEAAQGQLAGWCRVPMGHLARALPCADGASGTGVAVLGGRAGSTGRPRR